MCSRAYAIPVQTIFPFNRNKITSVNMKFESSWFTKKGYKTLSTNFRPDSMVAYQVFGNINIIDVWQYRYKSQCSTTNLFNCYAAMTQNTAFWNALHCEKTRQRQLFVCSYQLRECQYSVKSHNTVPIYGIPHSNTEISAKNAPLKLLH